MKTVYLYRLESTDEGTFGVMVVDGHWWYSLELPDRDNQPNVSRIPAGEYNVERRWSGHFRKETYWVRGVPERSYILIHGANFAGDEELGWQSHLQGCITLGKRIGSFPNKYGKVQKAVLSSRQAITAFEKYLDKEPFRLVVSNV